MEDHQLRATSNQVTDDFHRLHPGIKPDVSTPDKLQIYLAHIKHQFMNWHKQHKIRLNAYGLTKQCNRIEEKLSKRLHTSHYIDLSKPIKICAELMRHLSDELNLAKCKNQLNYIQAQLQEVEKYRDSKGNDSTQARLQGLPILMPNTVADTIVNKARLPQIGDAVVATVAPERGNHFVMQITSNADESISLHAKSTSSDEDNLHENKHRALSAMEHYLFGRTGVPDTAILEISGTPKTVIQLSQTLPGISLRHYLLLVDLQTALKHVGGLVPMLNSNRFKNFIANRNHPRDGEAQFDDAYSELSDDVQLEQFVLQRAWRTLQQCVANQRLTEPTAEQLIKTANRLVATELVNADDVLFFSHCIQERWLDQNKLGTTWDPEMLMQGLHHCRSLTKINLTANEFFMARDPFELFDITVLEIAMFSGLLRHEDDGKSSNYQVTPRNGSTMLGLGWYDLDDIFGPIVNMTQLTGSTTKVYFSNFKNILFSLPMANRNLSNEMRDRIAAIPPGQFIMDWLQLLQDEVVASDTLISSDANTAKKTNAPLRLDENFVSMLHSNYTKIHQRCVDKDNFPNVTCMEMFAAIYPGHHHFYQQASQRSLADITCLQRDIGLYNRGHLAAEIPDDADSSEVMGRIKFTKPISTDYNEQTSIKELKSIMAKRLLSLSQRMQRRWAHSPSSPSSSPSTSPRLWQSPPRKLERRGSAPADIDTTTKTTNLPLSGLGESSSSAASTSSGKTSPPSTTAHARRHFS